MTPQELEAIREKANHDGWLSGRDIIEDLLDHIQSLERAKSELETRLAEKERENAELKELATGRLRSLGQAHKRILLLEKALSPKEGAGE